MTCNYWGSSYNSLKEFTGLCYDCLTSGYMTMICRNRLECLTCCRSHHSVLQDAKFTNNKKEHICTTSTPSYRSNNCQTFHREFDISACYDTEGGGNNPSKVKAEGQESLCYHIHSTVKAAYENVSAFLSFLNIYNKTVASVLIFTDFEFKVCK